jgi:dihydrofolate reductase
MRRLIAFEMVSLDGYFVDAHGEMSWARRQDPEWTGFAAENATGGSDLLFGRVTYEMMASFWPTSQAIQTMPAAATGMNQARKFVFSRTLDSASWNNTSVLKGDIATEVRTLKRAQGPPMVVLGSGSIVAQLAPQQLIDELQIVITPLALGGGRTLFNGAREPLHVLLCFEPDQRPALGP